MRGSLEPKSSWFPEKTSRRPSGPLQNTMVPGEGSKRCARHSQGDRPGTDGDGSSRGRAWRVRGLDGSQRTVTDGGGECEGKGDSGSRNSGSGRHPEPEARTSLAHWVRAIGEVQLKRRVGVSTSGEIQPQGGAGGQLPAGIGNLGEGERQTNRASTGSSLGGVVSFLPLKPRERGHNSRSH